MRRNTQIDFLKFLAVLFVLNSHMDLAYGEYRWLATGGAIGDVLFFFCSGYTLFLGRLGRFDVWYKRRIRRIYPSLFGFSIISFFLMNRPLSVGDIVLSGGGNWFISCIMIYYVILYIIRRWFMNKLNQVFLFFCIVVLLWYLFFFEEKDIVYMYKNTYFKWCHYFLFMLSGAIIGIKEVEIERKQYSVMSIIMGLVICLALFYGIQIMGSRYVLMANLQIISLLPLMGIVYGLYFLTNSNFMVHIYYKRELNLVISVIGGLCLELYIVQMPILTGENGILPFGFYRDELIHLFPLNVPILVLVVLIMAYMIRAIGRFFSQTFDSVEGYRWREIVSLK